MDQAVSNGDRSGHMVHTNRNINYKDIATVEVGNINHRPHQLLVKGSGAFGGS
jgi:hypothetical protein